MLYMYIENSKVIISIKKNNLELSHFEVNKSVIIIISGVIPRG